MSGVEPEAGSSAVLARSIAPHLVDAGVERPITVDQTNRSVVVDDAVIVKWFRPPRPVPHQGSEVLAHLAELGFDSMPAFHGTSVADGQVVATVAEYLAGATDGWAWYLGEVHAWIDGSLGRDVLDRRAVALGRLAGRLHVALATPSSVLPRPVDEVAVRSLHEGAIRLFDTARGVTAGATAARLADRWEQIRAALDSIGIDGTTPTITVHGDLHVGNVLAVGERLVVTDFDGNPIAGGDEPARQPAALDVAALLQSIDHIGRIVDHRTTGAHRDDLAGFITDSTDLALAAYRAELSAAGLDHLLDTALLRPMQVAQELHELVYAASHLPHWVYVPDATLAGMFPGTEA